MSTTPASFNEFSQRLNGAIADIDKLAEIDPDPMIGSIQRQLRFVRQWTLGGRRPDQQDLDKLTFGQITSRSVHETDAQLANELYELAHYLTFWPKNEPVRT